MLELNRIYNEDCMQGLKLIDDKSIDMILTDLPYGTTDNKWDKCLPLDELFRELNRVIKDNGCMAFTAQQPFETDLINANRRYFRYEWVWDKITPVGFLNANKMPLRRHENIVIFYKHLPTYNPQFTEGKPYTKIQRQNRCGENYGGVKSRWKTVTSDGHRYPVDILKILKRHGITDFSGGGGRSRLTQHKSRQNCSRTSSRPTPTRARLCLTAVWAAVQRRPRVSTPAGGT